VEGIGEDYVPQTFNSQVVDDWIRVTDKESFLMARKVSRMEGLLIGGSCGTVIAASLRYAERLGKNDLVVTVVQDTGRNYLSKVYNDNWMRANGFLDEEQQPATAADVLAYQGDRQLFSLTPQHTMQDAIDLFRKQGISQIPIIENDRVVGGVQEVTLARLLHEGHNPSSVPLSKIMARALPEVQETTRVDEIYRILMSGHTGVIVRKNGHIGGIVTRIDLVNFWDAAAMKKGR
jgi:cystathionine beta-synthase